MINFIPGLPSTASALNAERIRMEVVSQNIANANSSRGPNGKPYERQQVQFESVLAAQRTGDLSGVGISQVRVAGITTDHRQPKLVYNPHHPDANARGMVSLPDINIHEEMADLISSSRAFEANLAVVKNARSMAMQTLSIGKH